MGTFVTSVAGVAFYQAIAPFYPNMSVAPDWLLGFLFGWAAWPACISGPGRQKFVPARLIKILLSTIILSLSVFKLYYRLFQIRWPGRHMARPAGRCPRVTYSL